MAPNLASCPRPETLAGFLSGDLSLDQLARIEAHLAQCDSCGETLRATDVDDTLLRLARQANRLEDSDTEYLDRLIHRFRELPANTTLASAAAIDSANARSEEILPRLAPAKDDDELGRLAHYRILGLLGAGGMGVVYQAEDTRLRRLVALKVLRPSMGYISRQRFVQEARAVAAIDHDHVITIYEVGEEGCLAYIAMPWLAGETLEQRLQHESLLDAVEVTSIGQQVAAGLAAAHALGVVHRDVKPANIWLEAGRDRAKLLDFGLAQTSSDNSQLTETGIVAGTPTYMSPEQARGEHVDERSDLFSLGAVLYRTSTGTVPFQAGNPLATLTAIQQETPRAPQKVNPGVPWGLSSVIMSLLAKDPADRPESAAAIVGLLGDAISRTDRAEASAHVKTESRSRWWTVIAATLLVGLAAFFVAPIIISIATNRGELVIKTKDPRVKVEVLQGGERVRIIDLEKEQAITIRTGEYELQVSGAAEGLVLMPNKVTITRNRRTIVEVEHKDDELAAGAAAPLSMGGGYGSSGPEDQDVKKRSDARLLALRNLEVKYGSGRLRFRPISEYRQEGIQHFVVLTGLVPLKAQFELYKDAYSIENGFNPERDFPNYLNAFQVERAEVATDGSLGPWHQIWGALDREKRSEEESRARKLVKMQPTEAMERLSVYDSALIMPFPLFVRFPTGVPGIALKALRDDWGYGNSRYDAGGPLGGGSGYGGVGGYGGGYDHPSRRDDRFDADENPLRMPEHKLFRFFDLTVKPNRAYRYRVRLCLEDPNNPLNPLARPSPATLESNVIARIVKLKKRERQEERKACVYWRFTDWSAPSDVISIPRDDGN